jgi:hypothetical protein
VAATAAAAALAVQTNRHTTVLLWVTLDHIETHIDEHCFFFRIFCVEECALGVWQRPNVGAAARAATTAADAVAKAVIVSLFKS